MKKLVTRTATVTAVLLSFLWATPAAVADEETAVDVVAKVAPADVEAATDADLLAGPVDHVSFDDLVVRVSSEAADGVSVSTGVGAATIGLPFAESASSGSSTAAGTVTFDNMDSTRSVVLVRETGTVQIATVIGNAGAPRRYDYPITVPEGSALVLQDSGGAAVINEATGEVLGSFAQPWAKDANGRDVPTFYELNDQTLTQVVDHTATMAYPIVADPKYTTSVIYLNRTQVVNMYKGLKNLNGICGLFPIPYPASIACAGIAPAAQIEKAYWQKLRIKVTYYNCGFNYCSYTKYTAVK